MLYIASPLTDELNDSIQLMPQARKTALYVKGEDLPIAICIAVAQSSRGVRHGYCNGWRLSIKSWTLNWILVFVRTIVRYARCRRYCGAAGSCSCDAMIHSPCSKVVIVSGWGRSRARTADFYIFMEGPAWARHIHRTSFLFNQRLLGRWKLGWAVWRHFCSGPFHRFLVVSTNLAEIFIKRRRKNAAKALPGRGLVAPDT